MKTRAAEHGSDLPLSVWRRIDSACDVFEASWRAGQEPDLAAMLSGVSNEAHGRLLRELLNLELEFRIGRGEQPDIAAYRERFPDHGDAIDEAFAAFRFDGKTLPGLMGRTRGEGIPSASGLNVTEFGSRLAPAQLNPAVLETLRHAGYEIVGELGRGGMGVVYLARKVALGRLCAVKMIQAGAHAVPAAKARFRAEAEAIARLRHPNIVQIYHVGEAEGLPYLELEYVAGGSLDRAWARAPKTARAAASLVEVLARAIAEAHRRGIIHRDLKPANILLDTDGHPKVADFGLAKFLDSDDRLTKTQTVLGSPSYMAPEQAEGHSEQIGEPTDVYALGAILYELLTGRPPFRAATTLETLAQVKSAEPVPPSRLQPGLPRDIETICLTCLEKTPAKRYPSANALAEDLRRFLAHESILARPTSAWRRAWKWSLRRPTTAAALGVSATAAVLLLASALFYNARLQTAVRTARSAQHKATEERNLALKALDQLVYGDREELGEAAAARPLRRRQLATAIDMLNQVAEGAEASAPDLSRAVAHQKLADIFRQVGRMSEAHRQYDLARRLAEGLAIPARRTMPILECLRGTYYGLGALVLKEGQFRAAIEYFERVVELSESIVQSDPTREGARRAQLEAYLQLGRAHSFNADLKSAEVWFRKMHDSAEAWAAAEPENYAVKDLLASSYRKLADVRKLSHDPENARVDYLKAIAIGREVVAAEPGTMAYKGHLAIALDDLAGVAFRQGRVTEARGLYQEAERLFTDQAEADPESPDAQHWVLRAQYNLASLERDEQRYTESAALFRRALSRVNRLKRAGRLAATAEQKWQRADILKEQLDLCLAAPQAIGPLPAILARPVGERARLLALRARLLAAHRQPVDALEAIKALCDLKSEDASDLFEIARGLAASLSVLSGSAFTSQAFPDLAARKARCAERALASLSDAIDRGLADRPRVESDPAFAALTPLPAYQKLLARLRPGR